VPCRGCGGRHWIIDKERWRGWREGVSVYEVHAHCKHCGRRRSWEQPRPWETHRPIGEAMRITDIQDQGTIVVVFLAESEDAPAERVVFDHRSFSELVEARKGDLQGECHLEYSEDGPPVLVFDKDAPLK